MKKLPIEVEKVTFTSGGRMMTIEAPDLKVWLSDAQFFGLDADLLKRALRDTQDKLREAEKILVSVALFLPNDLRDRIYDSFPAVRRASCAQETTSPSTTSSDEADPLLDVFPSPTWR